MGFVANIFKTLAILRGKTGARYNSGSSPLLRWGPGPVADQAAPQTQLRCQRPNDHLFPQPIRNFPQPNRCFPRTVCTPDNHHYNYNGTPTAISEAETEFSETASAFEILRARTLKFANTLSSSPSPFCPEYSDDARLLAPSVTAYSMFAAAASIVAVAAGVVTAATAYANTAAATAAFGSGCGGEHCDDVPGTSYDRPEPSI